MSVFSIHRWWQSFGFGIQSKTDFAFLHEVLREPWPYYAYDRLKRLFPQATKREHKRAQTIFRICNNLHKQEIILVGSFSELEKEAINIAMTFPPTYTNSIDFTDKKKTYLIKHINNHNKELWQKVLCSNTITYDMVDLGIAFFNTNRYPEHYELLRL